MIATISGEAQRFLDALKEYGTLVSAPAGAVLGYMAGRRKNDAEATKLEADAGAVTLDSMTRSFRTMIEGYEERIADLTREVDSLREEVKALRKELDRRPRLISDDRVEKPITDDDVDDPAEKFRRRSAPFNGFSA